MAAKVDPQSGYIRLPLGDTLNFKVRFPTSEHESGTLIRLAFVNRGGTDIFHKDATLTTDTEDATKLIADLSLTNADTRDLPQGEYVWQLREITSPSSGAAQTTSKVTSQFDGGYQPKITLTKDGAYI